LPFSVPRPFSGVVANRVDKKHPNLEKNSRLHLFYEGFDFFFRVQKPTANEHRVPDAPKVGVPVSLLRGDAPSFGALHLDPQTPRGHEEVGR
jgi:hypothetical protein